MARVVRFHKTGGPEVLRIEQIEVPPPGKGEVQIRIHVLGLNRAEVMFRAGQYVSQPRFPARPQGFAAGRRALGFRFFFTSRSRVAHNDSKVSINRFEFVASLGDLPSEWAETALSCALISESFFLPTIAIASKRFSWRSAKTFACSAVVRREKPPLGAHSTSHQDASHSYRTTARRSGRVPP